MYVSVSWIISNLPQHEGGYPHNLSNQVVVALFMEEEVKSLQRLLLAGLSKISKLPMHQRACVESIVVLWGVSAKDYYLYSKQLL